MTGMEFELGMLMYRIVLRSFKEHCEERDCHSNKYDLEKIQDAIRKNVRER